MAYFSVNSRKERTKRQIAVKICPPMYGVCVFVSLLSPLVFLFLEFCIFLRHSVRTIRKDFYTHTVLSDFTYFSSRLAAVCVGNKASPTVH
jgi:hypothetical protein